MGVELILQVTRSVIEDVQTAGLTSGLARNPLRGVRSPHLDDDGCQGARQAPGDEGFARSLYLERSLPVERRSVESSGG
jgi:hypothetical protein